MVFLLLLAGLAHAEIPTDEVKCLRALAEFEYGKDLKFNAMAISTQLKDGPRTNTYAWDGLKVWQVFKQRTPRPSSTKKNPNEGVFLRMADKSELWSLEKFEKNHDGRIHRKTSEAQMQTIVEQFLKQSFQHFYFRPSMGAQMRPTVMEACQRISAIEIEVENHRKLSIAAAVRLQWQIYQANPKATAAPAH